MAFFSGKSWDFLRSSTQLATSFFTGSSPPSSKWPAASSGTIESQDFQASASASADKKTTWKSTSKKEVKSVHTVEKNSCFAIAT